MAAFNDGKGTAMDQLDLQPSRSANGIRDVALRDQLLNRRERLQTALPAVPSAERIQELLGEVDAALERMEAGTFGRCETCDGEIENERLLVDPLCRNCLDHLSPSEQRALARDLDLAFQVQNGLLPKSDHFLDGWTMAYHYEPAGLVSGDYCDLIALGTGQALFLLGDVTGKGVAASMLMAQLYAIFRSLVASTQSPAELLAKANRIFCEGTLASHFATVVCGRIGRDGMVEISNGGHCLPLYLHGRLVSSVPSSGLPLGIFCDAEYGTQRIKLEEGDSLILHSDGLTEARNNSGQQYGPGRLARLLEEGAAHGPAKLLAASLEDLQAFRGSARKSDDLTIMMLRRERVTG
jgi:sigma-B regulation protein RsbU (phosphoserine phosphatase)